eukprot:3372624-Rhodomonas_salina.3
MPNKQTNKQTNRTEQNKRARERSHRLELRTLGNHDAAAVVLGHLHRTRVAASTNASTNAPRKQRQDRVVLAQRKWFLWQYVL